MQVAPQEIFRLDKYEDLSATPVLHEEMTEHENQSLGEGGKVPPFHLASALIHNFLIVIESVSATVLALTKQCSNSQAVLDSNGDSKDCQKSSFVSPSFSLPQVAIGFFTSIASSLFGSMGFTSLLGTSDHVVEDGQRSGISSEDEEMELQSLCTLGPKSTASHWPKVEGTQDSKEIPYSSGREYHELFKQFDMVSGCSDHHFVDGAGKGLMPSQV